MIITLTVPVGHDEIVDEPRAREIRDLWVGLMPSGGHPIRFEGSASTYTVDGAKVLGKFLSLFGDRVTEIDLSDIRQYGKNKTNVLKIFMDALQNSPLVEINLGYNHLGFNGIEYAKTLLAKTTLRRLCLSRTNLNSDAMANLFHHLEPNQEYLTHLALSENPECGVDGGKTFGKLISKCPNLVYIEYANCKPGLEGSKYITRGLDKIVDSHLEEDKECGLLRLDLPGSDFSIGGGFDKLVGALRTLKQLQKVNLSNCRIHPSGMGKLRRILCQARLPGLTDLSLDQGDDFVEDLIEDFSQLPVPRATPTKVYVR